jgi:hypothetical protein
MEDYVMFKGKLLLGSLILICLILITSCTPLPDFSQKFSGGGHIPSAVDPEKKANFGFHYDGTKDPPKLHGTYHDKAADISIRFSEVVTTYENQDGAPSKCMVAEFNFEPLGSNIDGGLAGILACDNVDNEYEIPDTEEIRTYCESYPCDYLVIFIGSDYINYGQIMGGNLKNLD